MWVTGYILFWVVMYTNQAVNWLNMQKYLTQWPERKSIQTFDINMMVSDERLSDMIDHFHRKMTFISFWALHTSWTENCFSMMNFTWYLWISVLTLSRWRFTVNFLEYFILFHFDVFFFPQKQCASLSTLQNQARPMVSLNDFDSV